MMRLRLTAAPIPEDDIQGSFVRWCDLMLPPCVQWTAFPSDGLRTPQGGARLVRLGWKPGWPDWQAVWRGAYYGIEFKRAGNTLSRSKIIRRANGSMRERLGQVERHALLREAGVEDRLVVCTSADEAIAAVRRWGMPARESR